MSHQLRTLQTIKLYVCFNSNVTIHINQNTHFLKSVLHQQNVCPMASQSDYHHNQYNSIPNKKYWVSCNHDMQSGSFKRCHGQRFIATVRGISEDKRSSGTERLEPDQYRCRKTEKEKHSNYCWYPFKWRGIILMYKSS